MHSFGWQLHIGTICGIRVQHSGTILATNSV
jgi:hypothetical protein